MYRFLFCHSFYFACFNSINNSPSRCLFKILKVSVLIEFGTFLKTYQILFSWATTKISNWNILYTICWKGKIRFNNHERFESMNWSDPSFIAKAYSNSFHHCTMNNCCFWSRMSREIINIQMKVSSSEEQLSVIGLINITWWCDVGAARA